MIFGFIKALRSLGLNKLSVNFEGGGHIPSFVIIDEEFFLIRNEEGLEAACKLFAAEWLVNSLDALNVDKVVDHVPEMNQPYPVLAHLYVDKNTFGEYHVCCDAVPLERVKEAILKF